MIVNPWDESPCYIFHPSISQNCIRSRFSLKDSVNGTCFDFLIIKIWFLRTTRKFSWNSQVIIFILIVRFFNYIKFLWLLYYKLLSIMFLRQLAFRDFAQCLKEVEKRKQGDLSVLIDFIIYDIISPFTVVCNMIFGQLKL